MRRKETLRVRLLNSGTACRCPENRCDRVIDLVWSEYRARTPWYKVSEAFVLSWIYRKDICVGHSVVRLVRHQPSKQFYVKILRQPPVPSNDNTLHNLNPAWKVHRKDLQHETYTNTPTSPKPALLQTPQNK